MKKLGFGLMRLPLMKEKNDFASVDIEQAKQMVDAFIERGFTYFDTAYVYHQSKGEMITKEVLVKRHARNSFQLATKMPMWEMQTKDDMERIFNEQLDQCGVTYFDYYLLHSLNQNHYAIAEQVDSFDFVQKKKAEGKIKRIGFSFHDKVELLDEILAAHPEMEFVQLQINYLDWENEDVQSRKCYEVARKHGKDVIVMEPVRGGALAAIPIEAEKLFRDYAPEKSIASWAVRFAASKEGVLVVLSGMSNMEQLLDNASYMQNFIPLNAEEKEIVNKVSDIMTVHLEIPCTACNYCIDDCPNHIPIPKYFALYNVGNRAGATGFLAQQEDYNTYAKTEGKASDCIACNQCVSHCPQKIEIVEMLKKVAGAFE